MKTQVTIDLNNEQRNDLKIKLDGKASKKVLSRDEVRTLCQDMFEGLLAAELSKATPGPSGKVAEVVSIYDHPFYKVAPEDVEHLAGRSLGFIYGYNKVKYSSRA